MEQDHNEPCDKCGSEQNVSEYVYTYNEYYGSKFHIETEYICKDCEGHNDSE